MASKLPSFIKLPGYNTFDYKPRFFDPNEEKRKDRKTRIRFKKGSFRGQNPIADEFSKTKTYSRRKVTLITMLIRVIIVILIVLIIYYVFYGVSLINEIAK